MSTIPKRRPIRFLASGGRTGDPAKLIAAARKAEQMGFSTFGMADHFDMPLAPLIALQAVAGATSTIRLTQIVLAQGFRHPAVLAKELATIDVLSGGRLEIGMGAAWKQEEFEQAGIPFPPAAERIERLEEAVILMKGLFGAEPVTFEGRHFAVTGLEGTPKPAQRPHPPIMIGGGGPKLLAAAGRQADIVQVLPGPQRGTGRPGAEAYSAGAYQEKVDRIRAAAGDRFDQIELGTLLLNVTITDDPDRALDEFMQTLLPGLLEGPGAAANRELLRASPVVAIGSLEEVCEKLKATRDTLGFSYFASPVGSPPDVLAPVIARLAGD